MANFRHGQPCWWKARDQRITLPGRGLRDWIRGEWHRGTFHQFGQEHTDYESGMGGVLVAIVECNSSGRVHITDAEKISFADEKPTH
jgi:hypothetical protein